jgi:hypothetical protein
MKTSNAAGLTSTAIVRAQNPLTTCRAIDFRTGADHIQSRRGVDLATSDTLITFKANHRIGVQRAVAKE